MGTGQGEAAVPELLGNVDIGMFWYPEPGVETAGC